MKIRAIKFRWFILFLFFATLLASLAVSGTAIFWIRGAAVERVTGTKANHTVRNLAVRTEAMLAGVEQSLITLVHASSLIPQDKFSNLVLTTTDSQPLIRAMYFLDEEGKTFAIWTREGRSPTHPDFKGIDFSYTPLYRSLDTLYESVWSDKFVSTLAGNTSIGVGIRIKGRAAIAELKLETLLQTVEIASGPDVRLWVIDRVGEVLADTAQRRFTGVINIRREPIIELATAGKKLPQTVRFQGARYHPAAARSEKLGWLFLAGIPAGLENPLMKNTLMDIVLLSGSFLLAALLLSPFWSQSTASQLNSLKHLADRIAVGGELPKLRKWGIQEFNELSGYLKMMSEHIREREKALRVLNRELEQRVADRTEELQASNQELRASLENNTKMQDLLVQTEKLAALGRLVAGIAHELNTPIGNAVMSISTVKEEQKRLEKKMGDGLRKSDLERFLSYSAQGMEIADRNVNRAAELISSFKHVASDQTSSVRRKFELSEMIRDVLLTLHPMLKRSAHQLETRIQEDLNLDSYPGVIGQIVSNLITNALMHAWGQNQTGTLIVKAERGDRDGWIRISISDDGKGIPESLRSRIFDPFFTTRMGRGGTGLGLNIAYNGARNILGGNLDFESDPGKGTSFHLDIPAKAPVLGNENPSLKQ